MNADIAKLKGRSISFRSNGWTENVFLNIDAYQANGRLYIGLGNIAEEEWGSYPEPFDDLTVNLPGYGLEENEAFISNDFGEEKLAFIKEHKLGTVTGSGVSGFATYARVAFDLERLKELDPEGMQRFSDYRKSRVL